MIEPITFESEQFIIHPLRRKDYERYDSLVEDIFAILSNEEVLTFIPEKRLKTLDHAKNHIFGIILGYEKSKTFAYLITIKQINRTIGIIKLISPEASKENYILKEYNWMIEYYLNRNTWGRNIMSEILPYFISKVLSQGVKKIGAACFPANLASIRLLEKSGFKKKYKFDDIQDYYEIS